MRLVLQRLVLGITKRGEVHSKHAGDFGNGLDGVLFHVYTAISERLSLTCDFYSDGLFFWWQFLRKTSGTESMARQGKKKCLQIEVGMTRLL